MSIQSPELRPFSYAPVGLLTTFQTRPTLPFNNEIQILVGRGKLDYEKLKHALLEGALFPAWARIRPVPIEPGLDVSMSAKIYGLRFHLPLRIIALIQQTDDGKAFGFVYGTLKGHYLSGEERFLIHWNPDTDEVHYQIQSFATIQKKWVWPLAPIIHLLQKRFLRESCQRARALCQPSA